MVSLLTEIVMPHWTIAILAFVALIAGMSICLQIRAQWIAVSRAGETFELFCASFSEEKVSQQILRAVYEKFETWIGKPFPVRADDKIGDIYGMVDEVLDDTILQILAECNRMCATGHQLERMPPILTIRNLVLYISKSDRAVGETL